MKVGYTIYQQEIAQLNEAGVTDIVLTDDKYNGNKHFMEFLRANKEKEVVLVNLSSISTFLSTIQLYAILEVISEQKNIIRFLDKGTEVALSDDAYFDILWDITSYEKTAVSNRVRRGMELSKLRGAPRGRPSLNEELIAKIRKLKVSEKKSIREIAHICGVSIGSVHKYIQEIAHGDEGTAAELS